MVVRMQFYCNFQDRNCGLSVDSSVSFLGKYILMDDKVNSL